MDVNDMDERWDKRFPLLRAVGKENPFNVPDGYFDDMRQQVTSRIIIESITSSDSEGNLTVPDGYFDTLEDQIMSSIRVGKLKDLTEDGGFTVPEGYFNSLNDSIKQKAGLVEKPEDPKVRTLVPSWLKYAAAACMMISATAGLYLFQKSDSIDKQLAYIPDEAIVEYLLVNSDAGDMPVIIDNINSTADLNPEIELSDQEIEQYLETTL
jgi:hypothetical protein